MKSKFSKKQATYWDSYTKGIDRLDLKKVPVAEKVELAFFKKIIGSLNGKSVLDLGCGTGKLGLKLSNKAKDVTGIDISRHSIEVANKTAKYYKIKNFKGKVGDFKKQGYKECFDIVLAVNLIHHTDDLKAILKHIRVALKNEGKLVIFEMNPLNLLFIPFLTLNGQIKSHLTYQYLRSNIFSLRHILDQNGYKIDQSIRWSWLPTSLANRSMAFVKVNELLNKIPLINQFTAFNVIICSRNVPTNRHRN